MFIELFNIFSVYQKGDRIKVRLRLKMQILYYMFIEYVHVL